MHVAISGGNMARGHKPSRRRAHIATATSLAALPFGGTALTQTPASAAGETKGHDVSSHQKNVN